MSLVLVQLLLLALVEGEGLVQALSIKLYFDDWGFLCRLFNVVILNLLISC